MDILQVLQNTLGDYSFCCFINKPFWLKSSTFILLIVRDKSSKARKVATTWNVKSDYSKWVTPSKSHEMIKKHNQKLEADLAKLKSKYEDEIAQMRASHTQLKTLFMKNNF